MHLLGEHIELELVLGLIVCNWHLDGCVPHWLVLIFLSCVVGAEDLGTIDHRHKALCEFRQSVPRQFRLENGQLEETRPWVLRFLWFLFLGH